MFVDPSTKCHLFADLRACGRGQEDLGEVTLYTHHTSTGGCGSYIDHEHLVLGKFLDLEIETKDKSDYVTHRETP